MKANTLKRIALITPCLIGEFFQLIAPLMQNVRGRDYSKLDLMVFPGAEK